MNKYYEKNLTTEEVTTSYYLGGRLIAQRKGTDLSYIHQDHLSSTSVMTDSSGDELGTIKYFPFGATRSGSVPTDKKFTGQRLDSTGLYYYGARYYDADMGRFISADTIVPDPFNPQAFNRYSYCLNNPLKYIDPSGHDYDYYYDPYYEASCAEADVDPSAGHILVYDNGKWESLGTTVAEFGSWIDSTPEPFDYITKSGTIRCLGSSGSFPLQYIEGQLGDISTIEMIHKGKVAKTFRFVWAETDMFGPRWVPSEYFTPAGDYYYNNQLMAPQVFATEVIAIRRQCMADDLNATADFIEFVGPGVSMIPPEFMGTGLMVLGLAYAPAAIAVGIIYVGSVFLPDALRGAANGIAPN